MIKSTKHLLFFMAFASLCLQSAVLAQSGSKELSLNEIINRTVAAEKARKKITGRYTYLQHMTKEELDDGGNPKETEKTVTRAVPMGKTQYNRLIKKNDKPLTGDDLEDEREKEQEFIEDLKKNKGKKKKEEGSFEFDEKFVAKYNFTLKGEQTLDSRPSYVVDYKPKSGDLKEEDMADRFMNKTKGTLWIDKEDFIIAKANTKLIEPVKVFGGIAASIKSMDFTIVMKKTGSEWFPSSLKQKIAGRKLVSSFNTKVDVKFDSFEKKAD